jgi:hypothetical protein
MMSGGQKAVVRPPRSGVAPRCGVISAFAWSLTIALQAAVASPAPDDPAELIADRAAVERVYHEHRTGTKPRFEQAMPRDLLEKLVRLDLRKEVVLRRVYGVTVTAEMVEAEVRRIATTTRAPEMLAELKSALGGDPARFARTVARPIVVERTLRARFENDDALHAPQRRLADELRGRFLAAPAAERVALLLVDKTGETREITWQLAPSPHEGSPPVPQVSSAPTTSKASGGAYSIEATAQIAQVLSSPESAAAPDAEPRFYFEDLEPELQAVLRAQLRQLGDVSAIIETPAAFLLFVAKEKTTEALTAASFTVRKRSYEQWLESQPL